MQIRPTWFTTSTAAAIASFLLLACGASPAPGANTTVPAAASQPSTAQAPISSPAVAAAEPQLPAATTPAVAVNIESRSGSNLKGSANFESTGDGVRVVLDVTSGPPGQHGAHIHQNADCSAADAKSAGDHFNPEMHDHALPPAQHRHLGDLGNIELDKNGKGRLEIVIPGANLLAGDKMSFLDRGVIIHEKIDNGGQPVGNAGSRIGCGEIKR